jgi:hypothetical protein
MAENLPRIEEVTAAQSTLRVRWRNARKTDIVDLIGWIATGDEVLAPLRDPVVFAKARIENYGAAVAWDDGDLAIDAVHLKQLVEEQKPFEADDLRRWQEHIKLSNNEAADLLGISVSSWCGYKAGTHAHIPKTVAMLCRAMLREPVIMQAHYRPRIAGRPRKAAS